MDFSRHGLDETGVWTLPNGNKFQAEAITYGGEKSLLIMPHEDNSKETVIHKSMDKPKAGWLSFFVDLQKSSNNNDIETCKAMLARVNA